MATRDFSIPIPKVLPIRHELLSAHRTVAQFKGLETRGCRFRSKPCPDKCGHTNLTGMFDIIRYLRYKKTSHYGDLEKTSFDFRVNDPPDRNGLVADTKETFDALEPGDFVVLAWNHDDLHEGCSTISVHPITVLMKLNEKEAKNWKI